MNTVKNEKTILVVEDNVDDVFFLKRIVKKAELEESVVFISDGEDAIRYLDDCLARPEPLPRAIPSLCNAAPSPGGAGAGPRGGGACPCG